MITNSEQQHYAGEVHLSYGSQLFLVLWTYFVSPAPALAALAAVARGLRGDRHLGNFYLDTWRTVVYIFLPLSVVAAIPMIAAGVPMTMDGAASVSTVEGMAQLIARGPVAAIEAIKQLATAGGGYFATNSCHPFETPGAWSSFVGMLLILLLPFAQVVMFGRMLGRPRQATVMFAAMLFILVVSALWCVNYDALSPNPALAQQHGQVYAQDLPEPGGRVKHVWVVAPPGRAAELVERDPAKNGQDKPAAPVMPGLPVDQSDWGNLEGKELRFGPGAGPAWAALTTATHNGSNNCMHDSLNPLAVLSPQASIWLNSSFGAIGSGVLNVLIYVIIAVFLAGHMIGRSPEYLGRKIGAREMKLATLALLIHPLLSLAPAGVFAAAGWGHASINNPGAHGFSELVYEFSSASANNGSGLEGLGDSFGFRDPDTNPTAPASFSLHWDIACGLVVVIGRFVPLVLLLALAGGLAAKPMHPEGVGTLRTDTLTFGLMLLGIIVLLGALLYLPAAMLGPVAEHWGPLPFGG
jgi:K+-transporting ATPase ATPase A chain